MTRRADPKNPGVGAALMMALTVRALLMMYWFARYGGYWIDGDTSRTTSTIVAVLNSGQLVPAAGRVNVSGFLYQVFSTFAVQLSGINVVDWQIWFAPVYSLVLTFLAFVLYLRTMEHAPAAGVAAVLLSLQGDFLFASSRGSHEKITFALVLISLLAMLLALTSFTSLRKRSALGFVYYLAVFALGATNVFFASTFVVNLTMAFLLWIVLSRWVGWIKAVPAWLGYVAAACFVLIFLIVFYIYPPALSSVLITTSLWERIKFFILSLGEPPASVYAAANQAWVFPQAWLILRSFDVFLVGMAAVGWLLLARRLRRADPASPLITTGNFWWLILFPAFVLQNVFGAISDITGSASDINNLQVRLAPMTAISAAPVATYALQCLFDRLRAARWRWLVTAGASGLLAIFVGMALIKSTSEPALSNMWSFYTPAEEQSIRWLNDQIPLLTLYNGVRTPRVWAGADFRLGQVWLNNYWQQTRQDVPLVSVSGERYAYMLLSPVVRAQLSRFQQPVPDVQPRLRVYDNGEVQIYYLRGQK